MFIDDVKIKITAGKGGDGAVFFNKEAKSLGPTGGEGGKGGDVLVRGVSDLGALSRFRFQKEFEAEDGKPGEPQCRSGKAGDDLFLFVPVGTVVCNLDTGEMLEITKINEEKIVAKGGKGGRGNFYFRSSTNTSPQKAESGVSGQSFQIRFELKLIADIGLIGLPNVGKSSLLNQLTRAKSKVANYRFTTLEPNLGVYNELILADIPGLIKGASEGKGLGFKFLRHIERTRILFHLIAADSSSPIEDYKTIREEIGAHSEELLEKKEYVFISKKDEVSESTVNSLVKEFEKMGIEAMPISIIEDKSIALFFNLLEELIREKKWKD